MRTWMTAALLALTITACGKSKIDKMISEQGDWKDKMCECKDKDCTEKVQKDYKARGEELQKDITEDDIKNASKDQMEKADKLDDEMRKCRHKFDSPAPTTP